MQSLWQCNVEWNEPLTDGNQRKWLSTAEDIQEAKGVQIPRLYFEMISNAKQPDSLHLFADASLIAYGAVAFLCRGRNTYSVVVKSRVAPLKPLTLPKLELMGALTSSTNP